MPQISNLDLDGLLEIDPSELTSLEFYKAKAKNSNIEVLLIGEGSNSNYFIQINNDTGQIYSRSKSQVEADLENFQLVTSFVNISLE